MEQERIPFDIKYRPEIEAGKYLVETRLGTPARIICWDKKCYHPEDCYPIIALVNNKFENVNIYSKTGKYDYKERKNNRDLFLVVNPDYKEPIAEPSVSVEPSEAAVLATMSALKAEFTNYEHFYQCRIKMRANLGTITEVWGQGETPYKAALEVYKQLKED